MSNASHRARCHYQWKECVDVTFNIERRWVFCTRLGMLLEESSWWLLFLWSWLDLWIIYVRVNKIGVFWWYSVLLAFQHLKKNTKTNRLPFPCLCTVLSVGQRSTWANENVYLHSSAPYSIVHADHLACFVTAAAACLCSNHTPACRSDTYSILSQLPHRDGKRKISSCDSDKPCFMMRLWGWHHQK